METGFESVINEYFENENIIIDKDDIVLNMNKWKREKDHNILLITGLSGSGKTSTSYEIANSKKAEVFQLDWLDSLDNITDYPKDAPNYGLKEYIKDNSSIKELNWGDDNYEKIIIDTFKLIKKFANLNTDKLFIIEGFQIYNKFNKSYITADTPIIVKGTSAVVSMLRRINRDGKSMHDCLIRDKLFSNYLDAEEKINKFRKILLQNNKSNKIEEKKYYKKEGIKMKIAFESVISSYFEKEDILTNIQDDVSMEGFLKNAGAVVLNGWDAFKETTGRIISTMLATIKEFCLKRATEFKKNTKMVFYSKPLTEFRNIISAHLDRVEKSRKEYMKNVSHDSSELFFGKDEDLTDNEKEVVAALEGKLERSEEYLTEYNDRLTSEMIKYSAKYANTVANPDITGVKFFTDIFSYIGNIFTLAAKSSKETYQALGKYNFGRKILVGFKYFTSILHPISFLLLVIVSCIAKSISSKKFTSEDVNDMVQNFAGAMNNGGTMNDLHSAYSDITAETNFDI